MAFANADGNSRVNKVEDNGQITGFKNQTINSLDDFKNISLWN